VICPEIIEKLRPHQPASVERLLAILRQYQSAVDLSDTGVGKMYVGAAVATLLGLPTLVVCPKVVVTAWHRAASHFGEKFSVVGYEKLRTGNTQFGQWEHPLPEDPAALDFFRCQSCQLKVDLANFSPCYTHHLGIHCVECHRKEHNYGRFNFHPGVQFVIFDEVQRCAGVDSLNCDMLLAVKRQNIRMLGLSATAACSPLGMRALGYNLDLHGDRHDEIRASIVLGESGPVRVYRQKKPFFRWLSDHSVRRDPRFHGLKWFAGRAEQRGIMAKIHAAIADRAVRVSVDSIPGFPERTITAELFDIDDPAAFDRLLREMAEPLAALASRAASDVDCEHPLTKLLRLRQRIELLKVPIMVELARDYVDKGYSVGCFVNFSQTIAELQARLKTDCIIDGSPAGVRHRQRNVDSFNANTARIILINSEAGGSAVSLPDATGDHPRVGLVFPGVRAETFRQLVGRFHRIDARSNCFYKVILAANTLEEGSHRKLCAKLDNLDQLNDDDFVPEAAHLSNCRLPINNHN
jgi:superfamily II DNA or RNA helicase